MDQVGNELARKRPAQIIDARPVVRGEQTRRIRFDVEVFESHDRWALLAGVHKDERRGLVRALSPAPVWNFTMGVWEMKVIRLKSAPPRWRRPLLIVLVVLAPLAVLFALIWWTITSLAAIALSSMLGFVFLLLVAGLLVGRSGGGNKTINISIRQ